MFIKFLFIHSPTFIHKIKFTTTEYSFSLSVLWDSATVHKTCYLKMIHSSFPSPPELGICRSWVCMEEVLDSDHGGKPLNCVA